MDSTPSAGRQTNCLASATAPKTGPKPRFLAGNHSRVGLLTLPDMLRNHAFTAGLADKHIALLASLATEVTFRENEIILLNGQHSQHFYLVTSGSVAVELHTPTFTVMVLPVRQGLAFGWSAILDH